MRRSPSILTSGAAASDNNIIGDVSGSLPARRRYRSMPAARSCNAAVSCCARAPCAPISHGGAVAHHRLLKELVLADPNSADDPVVLFDDAVIWIAPFIGEAIARTAKGFPPLRLSLPAMPVRWCARPRRAAARAPPRGRAGPRDNEMPLRRRRPGRSHAHEKFEIGGKDHAWPRLKLVRGKAHREPRCATVSAMMPRSPKGGGQLSQTAAARKSRP